jgi:hypothetical protein
MARTKHPGDRQYGGRGAPRGAGRSAVTRRLDERRGALARRLAGGGAAWLVCIGLGGCANTWDDVTSRDFHFRTMFNHAPEPLTVLHESTDGDARAKAMRALKEPLRNGGGQSEQDEVVRLLTAAAAGDPQPLCRMEAIKALGRFQDPRAVPALVSAYEAAAQMPAEVSGAIRGQALTALGETHQPAAITFLVKATQKTVPADAGDNERQRVRDTRLAAVRALRTFEGSAEVAGAMARLANDEKDVALRDRARETYVKVTGTEPPSGPVPSPAPPQQLQPYGVQLTGATQPRP